MGKKNDERQMSYAKWMKDHGITRKTGQCPMGCGRAVSNGGQALIIHLGNCKGKRS